MPELNQGITGAKRQSWRAANPREVLERLVAKNPEASEDELRELFHEIISKPSYAAHRRVVEDYWFTNNYRSLTLEAERTARAAARAAQKAGDVPPHALGTAPARVVGAEAANQSAAATAAETREVLTAIRRKFYELDVPGFNKKLGDMTGLELMNAGNAWTMLAVRVPADQRLRDVIPEEEARTLTGLSK